MSLEDCMPRFESSKQPFRGFDPLPSYIEPRTVVVGEERRRLSPLTWRVLQALWQRRDRVSTLDELLAAVYPPPQQPPDGNVLKVTFCRLRTALVGTPLRIEWVWRRGYRLIDADAPPVAVAPAPPAVAPAPPAVAPAAEAVAPTRRRTAKPTRFGGSGCRYLIDDRPHQCGAKRQPGSSYCTEHHAVCYLPRSGPGERRRLREIDRISEAVGGRQSPTGEMTPTFRRRVEQIQA